MEVHPEAAIAGVRRRAGAGGRNEGKDAESFGAAPVRGSDDGELIPIWVIYVCIVLGIIILVGTVLVGSLMHHDHAYFIMYNGVIHTSDDRMPEASILVVRDGRFVDVASESRLKELLAIHAHAEKIDLGGRTVLPGLIDSHLHVLHLGSASLQVQLGGAKSTEEVRSRIRKYLDHPPKAFDRTKHWVIGTGWDQTVMDDLSGQFPTAEHLDSDPVLRSVPIMLYRVDFHACWLNGAALATISANDPSSLKTGGPAIEGGEIVRLGDGRPSGILVDTAMKLAETAKPKFGEAFDLEAVSAAVNSMVQVGLTGVHDAATSLDRLAVYRKAVENKAMPIRLYGMLTCDDPMEYCGDEVDKINGLGGNKLELRSVKLFLDGALGSWGAYLWNHYDDKTETTGLLRVDPNKLSDLVWKWVENGWQVNSHAIGDKANSMIIDAYEKAVQKWKDLGRNSNELRLRIEHAQFVRPEDVKRIVDLGIIPSMQPTHCTSDMWYVEKRLGKERASREGYLWKSMLKAGVRALPLGSDAPVETANPFAGIYAAVTRKDPQGRSPWGAVGWNAGEALSREEALKGFTISAAFAAYQEELVGSITPGKLADFVIVDRDIMTCPEREIVDTKVLATVVGGKTVHGKLH